MFVKKWLLLVLLLINFPLYSAQKIVSVSTLSDYAPLLFSLDNQVIRTTLAPGEDSPVFHGYSWDVFRESLHIMGYTIQLNVKPWVRALQDFENGKTDIIFPTGKNENRLKKFNYSKQHINEAHFVIYIASNTPFQWKGLSSLKGLSIGVVRGFNYGDKWHNAEGIKRINIKNILTGFEMLEKGRLDGFLGYEFNWDYTLKEHGWHNKFHKLPEFDYSNEYVAALKSNKHGQKILNDFDLGKQKLIENGHLQALQLKWSLQENTPQTAFQLY